MTDLCNIKNKIFSVKICVNKLAIDHWLKHKLRSLTIFQIQPAPKLITQTIKKQYITHSVNQFPFYLNIVINQKNASYKIVRLYIPELFHQK